MPETLDISTLQTQIDRLAAEVEEALQASTERLESAARRLEREWYAALASEWVSELETDGGKVKKSRKNFVLLSRIDRLFSEFRRTVIAEELGYLPEDYLSFARLASQYFEEMEMAPLSRLQSIANDNSLVHARLFSSGFLDDLLNMYEVRTKSKTFILSAIVSEPSLKDFSRRLKRLVLGDQDQEGIVSAYMRRTAYDVFNEIHEIKNDQYAEALELPAFLYAGSTIDTTRQFCFDKVGRVFLVTEALAKWPKDPHLVGKNRPEPYNPLVDLGRWGCRHFKKYLTYQLYVAFKAKEAQEAKAA